MKKILLNAIIGISLLSSISSTYAQCGTSTVGISNYVQYSTLSDMAIAQDNKIYTFAYNTNASQFQLHAAYAASSWSLVATLSGYTTIKPDIKVSKAGKVSVFLRDDLDGGRGKVYTLSGSTFTAIGTAISTSSVSNLSLAFNLAGNECIAYTDISNSNKSTVKQWNGTSSWDNVGAGTVSTGGGFFNSLLVDKNDKYVLAFQDANSGNKTNVCRYNAGVWTSLGMIGSTANNCKLKEATNGDYYLGFTETANNAQIHKYNGSVWSQVGATISSISSTANNFDLELDAVDSPYLLAVTTSTPDIVFYRYSFSSWSMVTSFSNTSSNVLALSIDNKGLPFMFHVDVPSNAGLNVKQLVSMVNLTTQPTSTTVCVGQSPTFLVSTMGGSPFFQWQQAQFGEFSNIPGATSSSYSTPPANPGMNQYKYRCVVNSGCSNIISNSGTLTVTSLNINTTSTNPTCSGSNDGVITSTVVGGTFPYSYNWTPVGGTTSTASFLTAGSYTLNVVDANTCATSTVVSLTNPPAISSSFSGNFYICNGSSTTLTVTSTGGTGPYTYSWTPSASLSSSTGSVVTANPSSMQTYNVQATDVLGCIATTTVMVDFYANQPTITANSSSGTICNGSNVTLTSSGINVDTYVWNPGGLSGSSQNVTPSSSTVYTVTGTNTVTGCSASTTVAINVNSLPTANAGTTRTLTCVNTSTTLTGSAVGAISYNWSGPGIVAGATTLSPTINLPGTYSFVSMSAAGCVSPTSTVAVTQNTTSPSPTASTTGTLTCSTLTVALNGTPGTGVAYQWTGPGFSGGTTSQNAVANAAGSFTLRVTDAVNGCTNIAVTSVSQNTTTPTLSASTSSSSICAGSTTTLSATGVGVNTYVWQPGSLAGATRTVSPASTTIYTVTGTNTVTGCSASANITITVNPLPTITAGPTKSLTCASSFTTVTCSSVGGTSYNWTGPSIISGYTTTNCNVGSPGIYTVFAISPFFCNSTSTTVLVVSNTTPPTATASSSGSITCVTSTVALTGGPGTGVTYQWSGPGFSGGTTSQNAVANAAGTYTLKVTSSVNSCTNAATAVVNQNTTTPSIVAASSPSIICGGSTSTLTATGANTYTWTPGAIISSSIVVTPTATSVYSVSGTNTISGCQSTSTVAVTVNSLPVINATASSPNICNGSSATITSSGANTYTTMPGNLTGSFVLVFPPNTSTTTYTVSGTNTVTGCVNTKTVSISTNPNPTVSIVSNPTTICSGSSATMTASGAVSYTWNPGSLTGSSITVNPASTTIYTITGAIASCTGTANSTITVNNLPVANAGPSSTLTCTNSIATLAGSGTGSPTYSWTGPGIVSGSNTASPNVNQPGTYSLVVQSLGCNSSPATVTVIQNTLSPSANAGMDQSLTCLTSTVTLIGSATPSSCTPVWTGGVSSGSNSYNATTSIVGIYTLTVTDPSNGCFASDIVQVNANTLSPNINTIATATLDCINTSVNAVATTTSSPVSFIWSGPGIISGAASSTATVNQPGTYTVTTTDIINGCSISNTVSVNQDITLPIISINTTSSSICSGNSTTLTANGATTYSWNSGATTTSISVSPTLTTVYLVTGTGVNGCSDIMTQTITVNSTPTLSILGNKNICKGSTSILTGSGATSYTWNTGANTTSISVSPTITTTYTLNGDNGNGCSSSLPITISIIPNKSITGVITSTAGATTGDVTLYKYTIGLSQWDSITTVPFTSSYSFANIDSALYVVRAIPTATNIQVTYGDNAITWQNATVINHGCSNNSLQNIGLVALETFTPGPGVLSGTILEEDGFGQKISNEFKPLVPGQPIGGIIVKGGRNPGGQMLVQTLTNAAGQYTLSGLPLNSVNESYFVFVDIPGLDTNGTYHVVVSTTDSIHNGLNFTVDSMHINPLDFVTSINSQDAILKNNIFVYPNPSRDDVTIKYELSKPSKVSIDLYNLMGEKTQIISPLINQEKGIFQHLINLRELSNGIFLIKFSINNNENYIKLIKTD